MKKSFGFENILWFQRLVYSVSVLAGCYKPEKRALKQGLLFRTMPNNVRSELLLCLSHVQVRLLTSTKTALITKLYKLQSLLFWPCLSVAVTQIVTRIFFFDLPRECECVIDTVKWLQIFQITVKSISQ